MAVGARAPAMELLPLLLLALLPLARCQGGEAYVYSYPDAARCPQASCWGFPLAAAAAAAAPFPRPPPQTTPCSAPPQLTISSLGADPTGNASAVATLERVEKGLPGMHFVSAGRYRIERNVTLTKPVVMDVNATFWLGPAATLVMLQPLTAPAQQVFAGPGRVEIQSGVSVLPEWWGEWRKGAGQGWERCGRCCGPA